MCTEGYDDLPYLLLRDRMSTRKAFEAVRGYFFGGVLADFVCMRVCVVCMCMCGAWCVWRGREGGKCVSFYFAFM